MSDEVKMMPAKQEVRGKRIEVSEYTVAELFSNHLPLPTIF
jgi:hypothetical protein